MFIIFSMWSPLCKMVTDSLWISVSVKRWGSILKEHLIICIKNDMLFSDVLAKIYPTDEENIDVRVQYVTIKSKGKWYSCVWNVMVFK